MDHDYSVTGLVIGCAIAVHKQLGPELKEESYENALCEALARQNIRFERGKDPYWSDSKPWLSAATARFNCRENRCR